MMTVILKRLRVMMKAVVVMMTARVNTKSVAESPKTRLFLCLSRRIPLVEVSETHEKIIVVNFLFIFAVAYSMNTSVDLLSQIYETAAYSKNKVQFSYHFFQILFHFLTPLRLSYILLATAFYVLTSRSPFTLKYSLFRF